MKRTPVDDGGNGDADRFAHYVSRDRIAESKMTGRPVVALCGKVWVPKRGGRSNLNAGNLIDVAQRDHDARDDFGVHLHHCIRLFYRSCRSHQ